MSESQNIQHIPLDQIRENPVALRSVNRDSESYQGLVASIREAGFISILTVRPMIDPETNDNYFEMVDGLHRFSAAQDCGLESVPCMVQTLNKEQVLDLQLMLNTHKIDTKPVEFTKQLQRMFVLNPSLTEPELAARLGKSPVWITTRLGLLKLGEKIQEMVDAGKITLSNAFVLAKLPLEEQASFVERAMTMPPAEFTPQVTARKKEINDARRQGKEAGEEVFTPIAHLQKRADIETERGSMVTLNTIIESTGVSTPAEGATIALDWVLHLDPASIEVQQAKYDERKAAKAAAAQKRKLDRAAKKKAEGEKEETDLLAQQDTDEAPKEKKKK